MTPTIAEEKLIKAANEGEIADYSDRSSEDPAAHDPAEGARWGSGRTIRAEIIYALAVGTNPEWPVHAKGVQVAGAKIVETLDFRAAKISRPVLLIKCYLAEPIDLIDATATTISLYGSHVGTIDAFRLATSGSVLLNKGFIAKGEVELYGARIGGDLDCSGATLESASGRALFADGLQVQGSVFLRAWQPHVGNVRPFRAIGEVRLPGARIQGDLDCSGGLFEGHASRALTADRLVVNGDVCLRDKFSAKGEVRLLAGELRGNLDCAQATFENPGGMALNGDSLSVSGNVLLWRGFQASAMVRMVGATIHGDLNCSGGSFCAPKTMNNPHGFALSIDRAQMKELFFCHLTHPPRGVVNLAYAKATLLNDDALSWPEPGKLWLDGFVYDTLAAEAPTQANNRLDWLNRQPKDKFWPQPYERLIHVLRLLGHERDARKIAIAKQEAARRTGQLGTGARIWSWCLGVTVGHGYKAGRAILWMLLLIAIGAGVFCEAHRAGVMMPSKESVYHDYKPGSIHRPTWQPEFQPVFYSIDVFLPFVDLHQKSSWWLHERKSWDWVYLSCEFYFLVHTILGWSLTGLLVAALTGIIKHD